jgi:NADH-quinone oxidoreductase subunit L
VGIPHVIAAVLPGHPHNLLLDWVTPVIAEIKWPHYSAAIEWSLMGISVGAAGVSAALAYTCYVHGPAWFKKLHEKIKPLHTTVENKYYVDEFYFGKIINPLVEISRGLWAYIDVNFVDKTTYLISDLIVSAGGGLRSLQSGNMQQYALYIALGVVGVILYLVAG